MINTNTKTMSDLKNFLDLQHEHNILKAHADLMSKNLIEGSLKIKSLEKLVLKSIEIYESCYEVLGRDEFHDYLDMCEAVGYENFSKRCEIEHFIIDKEKEMERLRKGK